MSVFHSNIYFIKTRANLTECYVQCYLFDFITVCNYNEKDLVFDMFFMKLNVYISGSHRQSRTFSLSV